MPQVWHEHMATPFYDNFSDTRMSTLVIKHGNYLFGWQVSVFLFVFSFRMATLVVKNVRAGVLRATHVALINGGC